MSRNTPAQKPLHLIFTQAQGFQFYTTLPSHLAVFQALPRQVRWSLGRDEALARQMCQYLNKVFSDPLFTNASPTSDDVERLVKIIDYTHKIIDAMRNTPEQIWALIPHPSALSRTDLSTGHARLQKLSDGYKKYVRKDESGEYVFILRPSPQLQAVTRMHWHRLDWPLGTTDESTAVHAIAYILTAIDNLEQFDFETHEGERYKGAFALLALYEYLQFSRPDGGRALDYMPSLLPQSLTALKPNMRLNTSPGTKRFLKNAHISQNADGFIIVSHEMNGTMVKEKKRFELNLQTTSPIVGYLLYMKLSNKIDFILARHCRDGFSNGHFEKAMAEIESLLTNVTVSMRESDTLPLLALPEHQDSRSEETAQQVKLDPATEDLVSALSSLLPESKRDRLHALLYDSPAASPIENPTLPDNNEMTLSALIDHYLTTQRAQSAWRNPRTHICVNARLDAMCELLGGHRALKTLSRSDFIRLRDEIRQYPKNRNRIQKSRNQSLRELMEDPSVESIAPPTAKKFFELIKAVMRHAYDNEFITADITQNLSFKTSGSKQAKDRTYSFGQVQKLLNGPAYLLTSAPRWRLDDYKFWLPLLGLYTGCRLAELCQLELDDIEMEKNIWLIKISSSGHRHLKTYESERTVPVHHALIKMGFIDFVKMRRSESQTGQTRLFKKLRNYGVLASSHTASKWYLGHSKHDAGYLGLCGLANDNLTFHGLRHTFIQQFRQQNLNIMILKALVGHADRTTTGGYGHAYPVEVLNEEINKLDYGVEIMHIHYTNYFALQKGQSRFRTGKPGNTDNT